ncbi:MAG: hypothetical protein AAF950_10370 [Pseudomonadota bacterium]
MIAIWKLLFAGATLLILMMAGLFVWDQPIPPTLGKALVTLLIASLALFILRGMIGPRRSKKS